MPEQTHGDPSGVPRPVEPERIEKARANSGIIVGQEPDHSQTTAGTQQDNYKTAFVKVYQDAGVIGVAMLTLLALCVILAMFAGRVLKMYSTLVEANGRLVQTQSDATLKIAAAMTILDSRLTSVAAESRREVDEMLSAAREISERVTRLDDKVTGAIAASVARRENSQ